MISTLHTDSDFIYAYIEWVVVDELGKPRNNGEYVYIVNLWVHPWYRFKNVIKTLIPLIDKHPSTANVKWIYWTNLKHKRRKTPTYKRSRFINEGTRHVLFS